MKKFLLLLILLIIPINCFAVEIDITSGNAILYNMNDNSILYEKDKDSKVSIASLTKIMTCIVALEHIDNLEDTVTLTNADFKGLAEANASVAGFRVGEVVTYKDLLYGLMLPSGADAALALTRNIAGGENEFVDLMNKKKDELKLNNTHFVNPTGLDSENHYSSVEDVSKIFQYALKNEEFKKIITSSSYTTSNGRLTFKSTISKALSQYNISMDYLLGGKTGTTGDAGLCLASIAERDGVNYMLVTVKAPYSRTVPNNYYDQKKIYEYFMDNYGYKNIVDKGDILVEIPTVYATVDKVKVKASDNISKYLENSFDKKNITYKYEGIDSIKYNLKKGEKLGKIKVIYNDEVLETIDVKLDSELKFDFIKYLDGNKVMVIIVLSIIVLLIGIIVRFKKKKKNK